MIRASEKEYEILKSEVAEVKACITRYIGYIIGLTGLAGLSIKYFSSPSSVFTLLLIIQVAALLIILLFEIIWYKFNSHNRYVGYIQLLTQEVGYNELTEEMIKDVDKSYLDKCCSNSTKIDLTSNIFSWEFVMSRLNTSMFANVEGKTLSVSSKTKFVFRLPPGRKYSELPEEYCTLDKVFFIKVIQPLYGMHGTKDEGRRIFLFKKLFSTFIPLLFSVYNLYRPIRKTSFKFANTNIDKRYLSTGWLYPKKMVQVVMIPFSLLVGFYFFISYSKFDLILNNLLDQGLTLWVFSAFIMLLMYYTFLRRYVLRLSDVIYGKGSIDYYCWTFFLYRVQILNSFNIIPTYFSRNFIRFYKSRTILNYISERVVKVVGGDSKCICCEKNRATKTIDDGVLFCDNCLDEYIRCLENIIPLDVDIKKAHSFVNELMKENNKL